MLMVLLILCIIIGIIVSNAIKAKRKAEVTASGSVARRQIDNTVIRDLKDLRQYEKRLKRLRETQAKMERQ